jgi:uncharacterized protein
MRLPTAPSAAATMTAMGRLRDKGLRVGGAAAVAGAAASSYMAFEAQWPRCRTAELAVPRWPSEWSGVTVLHLSDVHAGVFATNYLSFDKVVAWASPLRPDLVFLTGDVLGDPHRSARYLRLLARLRPPLGMFAVTGNHEYGLGKGPLARARDARQLWAQAGAVLLSDSCVPLPPRDGCRLVICGADHLTAGFGLLDRATCGSRTPPAEDLRPGDVPILLIHQPPPPGSPLARVFSLAFAGHTHGGQLRIPGPSGLRPVVDEDRAYLAGVYEWGEGRLVVSRGVGTSFVPFRLFTRPEATLWRLV